MEAHDREEYYLDQDNLEYYENLEDNDQPVEYSLDPKHYEEDNEESKHNSLDPLSGKSSA